jgi:hypothetical protein
MVTGAADLSDDSISQMLSNGELGYFTSNNDIIVFNKLIEDTLTWLNINSSNNGYTIVYPRIEI